MKKFFRILMWIIIAAIFAGTFVYLFLNSKGKETTYELVSPRQMTVERTTVLTGNIEPRDEIEIKPQISGIISEILVEPGDHVNNGDIIAKIKVIPEATQLSSAENRIRVAKISLEQARQTYERTKALFDKKYESREKYETDLAAYRQAMSFIARPSRNSSRPTTSCASSATGCLLSIRRVPTRWYALR